MAPQCRISQFDPSFAPARAAATGAIAAVAYLGIMAVDMKAAGSPSDDLLLLGRPLSANTGTARRIGMILHLGFGSVMGVLYGAGARQHLGGPNWLRGVVMMLVENTVLWPLTLLADRYHPAMRSGELPKFNRPVPFLQQVARHIGFGAVLGILYGAGRKRVTSIPSRNT